MRGIRCGGKYHSYPDCTGCGLLHDSCDGSDEQQEKEAAEFEKEKKPIGLGYANGWKPDGPQQAIVDRCRELGHKTTEERLRMHNYRYTCEKCGYRYQVDSS